jgi:hypothetical protein
MKTNLYISTLLALTIQVMVKSQTPANQVYQYSENSLLVCAQKLDLADDEKNELLIQTDPSVFIKQSNEIKQKIQELRNDAIGRTPEEKKALFAEANRLYKQAVVKQMEASELSSLITKEKFNKNASDLTALVELNKVNDKATERAKDLIIEAAKAIKIAKEIREEAYAWTGLAAKLGNMGNAEEKELEALYMQNEAIDLLEQSIPVATLKAHKFNQIAMNSVALK